ncbi:Prs ADP-ribosylating antitoxin (plasmid) [Rhodovastum atsumiense]|uniref:antitoxin Xre/MbcA/ParS toxin-binding domain-containing protein n=1 Tax=Rhodovastum atsumiense TaxID=504468 RepID=UPI002023E447|nr:antitoxin Xre/MbcA/ParS toxin-binding domain-containing protein [Rhodovastum atsumiense]CAH2605767.1 Prs ADP-ribosylating antitoxin [Rhodovastum atsumiense]
MPRAASSVGTIPPSSGTAPAELSYLDVFRPPQERISMIRHGLWATEAKRILAERAIGQGAVLKALNMSAATFNKKVKQDLPLSRDEGERVLGIARLRGQFQAMMEDSGNPEGFDAAAWLSRWLTEPLPSLGGIRPVDLMDTMEGQAVVATALAQIQAGAYA